MNYLRTPTSWTLTQELDDVGFSFGGGLWGFGLPAGEIIANVSGEARWATYVMESDFLPSDFVNCTGLRFCLANGAAPLRWVQNTNAEVDAKNHVYEFAVEFNVPLLKDVPGFKDLSANLAGRLRQVFDLRRGRFLEDRTQLADRRFGAVARHPFVRLPRAEPQRSVPACRRHVDRFQDRLTGGSNQGMRLVTRGNPDLTPENGEDERRWASCALRTSSRASASRSTSTRPS